MTEKRKYKVYQVLYEQYEALEKQAREERKQTGKNITWSKILRQVITDHINKKG